MKLKHMDLSPEERAAQREERKVSMLKEGVETIHLSDDVVCVSHPSFKKKDAPTIYSRPIETVDEEAGYMLEETTQAWGKHMHYSAFQWWQATNNKNKGGVNRWKSSYYIARDTIIEGNIKLAYKAVQ